MYQGCEAINSPIGMCIILYNNAFIMEKINTSLIIIEL